MRDSVVSLRAVSRVCSKNIPVCRYFCRYLLWYSPMGPFDLWLSGERNVIKTRSRQLWMLCWQMLAGQQPTVVRPKLDKVRVVDMTMRRHHYVNMNAIRRHHYAYKDRYLKGTAFNALVAAPHFLSIKDNAYLRLPTEKFTNFEQSCHTFRTADF